MSPFNPDLDDVDAAVAYLQRSSSPVDLDLLSERAYYWTFRGQEEYFGGVTDSWLSTLLPSEHYPVAPWNGLDPEPSDCFLSKLPSPSPSHGHGVLPSYHCYSPIRGDAAPTPHPSPTCQVSREVESRREKSESLLLNSITDAELHIHSPKRPRTTSALKHGHARTVPDIDIENAPNYPSPTPSTLLQAPEQLTEPSSEPFSSKLKSKSPTKISYQIAIPLKSILKPKLGTLDTNVIDSLTRIGRLSSASTSIPISVSPSSNPNESGSLDLLKPKVPGNVADLDSLVIAHIGPSTTFEAITEDILPIQNQNNITVHSLDHDETDEPNLVQNSTPTPRSQTRTRTLRKRSLKSDDANPTSASPRSRKTARTSTSTMDALPLRRSMRRRDVKDTSDAISTRLTPVSKKSKLKTDVVGSESPLTELSD